MVQNRLTVSNIEYTEVAEEGYENPMGDLTSEALNENIIPRVTNLKERKRMWVEEQNLLSTLEMC